MTKGRLRNRARSTRGQGTRRSIQTKAPSARPPSSPLARTSPWPPRSLRRVSANSQPNRPRERKIRPGQSTVATPFGRKGAGDDRQGAGGHDRGAQPLGEPAGDEEPKAGREPAGERGGGEQQQPGQVDAALAPQIRESSHPHREHADHQRVARDRPGGQADRRLELAPDSGQGDVDDEQVDVEHHQAEAGGEEGEPLRGWAGTPARYYWWRWDGRN